MGFLFDRYQVFYESRILNCLAMKGPIGHKFILYPYLGGGKGG